MKEDGKSCRGFFRSSHAGLRDPHEEVVRRVMTVAQEAAARAAVEAEDAVRSALYSPTPRLPPLPEEPVSVRPPVVPKEDLPPTSRPRHPRTFE